jgi:L-threonylcarbamoyladenylate synthase
VTRDPAAPARETEVRSGDDPAAVATAAGIIRAGGLVAFPTETVYGLGANALDPVAVAGIFEAKNRPRFDPLIVHVADPGELGRWADPRDAADPRVTRLVSATWPGPLTVVLRKRPVIPGIVTAGLPTVGLRSPDHPVAQALIRAAGVPIAAPSANRFGRLSPTRAAHVVRQLGGRVGLVLDGGPCRIGVESTVVLLAAGRAVLLRPGGVPAEVIEALIGPLEVIADTDAGEAALAPGRSGAHYAPGPPLVVVAAGRRIVPAHPAERLGLLAASDAGRDRAERIAERTGDHFTAVEVLAPDGDPVRAAARLFEALHALDQAGLDRIVAQPVPEHGLGRAVMDRLRRAALDRSDG